MINKEFIYDKVLPYIKNECRYLDYLLIQNLFENKEKDIVEELKKYQNEDKGFGNALEPDVRMPHSSVVATDIAISILSELKDKTLKEDMIKDIVEYYENVYNPEKDRFLMVSKEVDDYPRAIWWNYKDLEKNFPFGNPDPEVIGFLYENRKYVKKLDLNHLINKVVNFIKSDAFMDSGMHALMSVLSFHGKVDKDVQNLIHDRIHLLVDKEINAGLGKWGEYSLEPYKIYVIDRHFTENHLTSLNENLDYNLQKVKELSIMPNWNWHQFEEEFEKAKFDWVGYLYYQVIKALRLHRT
jgi:hypothetical protein